MPKRKKRHYCRVCGQLKSCRKYLDNGNWFCKDCWIHR